MIVLPLEASLPHQELRANESDVIYLGQIDRRTDSKWFLFGVLVFNRKVYFFRSSKDNAHALLDFQASEEVDIRWNSLMRIVCLKTHLRGAFFAGWNKDTFYILDFSADSDFRTKFTALDCGVFLPLVVCRVSETRVNEFLVVGQRGHFSVIQIGFKNHAIKLGSQLLVPGARISSALLYESSVIALVSNDVIVFNCQSKTVVIKSTLPGSDLVSLAIVQNKLIVLSTRYIFSMPMKLSKTGNDDTLIPFDWGEELYVLENVFNGDKDEESLQMTKWSQSSVNIEKLQNFVVFENCVYLWNKEKIVIMDGENFSCVREIGLQPDQIPVPCPSVQGIAIVERGKIKVVISGVASGTLLEKIVNFSGISALDRFTDLNSEAKAGLPGYKLPKNVLDTQNDLIGYFLDRWRIYFEEYSSLDLDTQEISSNYLSAINQICSEVCRSNVLGTNPETRALLCLFLRHLITVFKCLNEKSRTNMNWRDILTEVGQCLRRLRSGIGFIEKIQSKQTVLNQSNQEDANDKRQERASRLSMSNLAAFSYDAFSAQKGACKNAAEMLVKNAPHDDIVFCLRRVDLKPDEIISRLQQRSFKAAVLHTALEGLAVKGNDEKMEALKAAVGEGTLYYFQDPELGMYSFSISSWSRMSTESFMDFKSALNYSKSNLSSFEDFLFAMKFGLSSALADVISCSNLDFQQVFDVAMTSNFRELIFEVLDSIYLTDKFKFSETFQNLRFSNIHNRRLFMEAEGNNNSLLELCKFLSNNELIYQDALLSLLPLVDVFALNLKDENLNPKVRQVLNIFMTSLARGDIDSLGRSFIDSKKLWNEQNANETGNLSDLALLVFWDLLDSETKDLFESKCIQASKPFEKIHSIMTNNYPKVITSTVYDLLEGNSYLKCDTLFLWQTHNKFREINAPSTATYPNFDDVMENGPSSLDCLPSYQHYLMHGRPAFAFQMILAHWSGLDESQQRRYRSRCIDNIRSIACKNVENCVIVASAVALMIMMGESTVYLRSRVQLLKFMGQNRRQLCLATPKAILNFESFSRVSKAMVSKFAIARRKSTDHTFVSVGNLMTETGHAETDYIQFLDKNFFLALFNTMLEYFPIMDLIKENNKDYFMYWIDILIFCHKFGFSIKQLLSLVTYLEDSPLKEHLELCFMKNYKTISRKLAASQKKQSVVAATKMQRNTFVTKRLQPQLSRGISVEGEINQSVSFTSTPSNSSLTKLSSVAEDNDSQSAASSDGGKSAINSMFVNFSSALRVIKPTSDLKVCSTLSKCKKPILMAACFHSVKDMTPEMFMGHFLSACGQNIGPKGHRNASVLTKVSLQTLTLATALTSLRRDCEPLESTHLTDELIQCLLAIPDMEKCLEKFEIFLESFYLENGTLVEDFKKSSESANLQFLDELFESSVKYFRNIEFQKKFVLAFSPLKEFLQSYGLANIYIRMYEKRIPFHFKLDMRQNFPDRVKVGKLVHTAITEQMSRGMTDEAVDLLKMALAEGLDFSALLMDLEFSAVNSDIVQACSPVVRESFFEAMLKSNVATYGMSLNKMIKHCNAQTNLSITELTFLLTMNLPLSEEVSNQLHVDSLQKYVELCYNDSDPTNSEKALEIYDSLLLKKFSLFTKIKTLMTALEKQPLKEYLQVRKGMSDQLFTNLVNEFIRRQSFDLAITICVYYGKSLPAIRFVIASLLLLEDKISLPDFSRFMDLRLVSNNQQPVNNLISSMCSQYYPHCAPFLRMYWEYHEWNKILKRAGYDVHSAILKCLELEKHNLIHDLVASNVVNGEMVVKCCLQFMFSHYQTRESLRNSKINSNFNYLLQLMPDKQMLMEKMCSLSFDLLKSQQYYAAVSLMNHVLELLGKTFHLTTVKKFEGISKNLAAVLRANFDYNLAVHCLKCLIRDKVMCTEIVQLLAQRKFLLDFIDSHFETALELRSIILPHLLQKEMVQSKAYLKKLNFIQEYAKVLRERAANNVKYKFSITMGTPEATQLLGEVAQDYFEAYNCFNQDKKFSEARFCLKQAKLCALQLQLFPETIGVMNLQTAPEVTFFDILDKLSHAVQIMAFLEAYDKAPILLPRFLCQKVIIGGDFKLFTAISNYLTFSDFMIRKVQHVVRLKQKECRGDEAAVNNMKHNLKEVIRRISKNRNVGKILYPQSK